VGSYDYSDYMEYYLLEEPRAGTLLAGAFDAIDHAVGTAPFSQNEAVKAICTEMAVGTLEAESLFNDLVKGQNVG